MHSSTFNDQTIVLTLSLPNKFLMRGVIAKYRNHRSVSKISGFEVHIVSHVVTRAATVHTAPHTG
jgi:hypothetical protein